MVPNGWALLTVGDIFDVQLGKMLNKEAKKKQPQLRYLGNSNVRWGEFELTELNSMYFSEREINKYKLEFNDILVCEGGEVGRCAIWEQHNSQILYQKALHRLRVKGEVVPKYFQNYMQSIAGTKLLEDYTSRTSIAHLTREKLLSLPIKLPPLSEQQKIAKILSTWDKAISTTERLIDSSTQQKKALMQQLLTGKKRLLDDSGKRFEGEWKKVKLGELFNFSTASSKSKFIDNSGQNYILDMGSVTREGKLKPTKKTLINKDFLSKGQLIMPKDDIGGGQIIGRVGYVDENCKYILSDHVYCLTSKESCSLFLSYLINSYPINKQLRRQANGTAQLGLGKKDAEKQTVSVPLELEEQQKIASVLTNADKEIELLEQQLADLQQEKKALMQVLLTGKKRVVVDEEE